VCSTLTGLREHSMHYARAFLELHRLRRPLNFSAQNFHSEFQVKYATLIPSNFKQSYNLISLD